MAKAPTDIRSLARSHTDTCIRTLHAIMTDKTAPGSSRVAAAVSLLDRGWGKPKETVEMTVRRGIAAELSDDALASIALGVSEGDTETSVDPPQLN